MHARDFSEQFCEQTQKTEIFRAAQPPPSDAGSRRLGASFSEVDLSESATKSEFTYNASMYNQSVHLDSTGNLVALYNHSASLIQI